MYYFTDKSGNICRGENPSVFGYSLIDGKMSWVAGKCTYLGVVVDDHINSAETGALSIVDGKVAIDDGKQKALNDARTASINKPDRLTTLTNLLVTKGIIKQGEI